MKILHLEDNGDDAELIRRLIVSEWPGCQITRVLDLAEFGDRLRGTKYDVILSDFQLPGFDGFDALRLARDLARDTAFVFVSGTIGEDRAIEAVRFGADDYVLKDRMKRLVTSIERAMRDASERQSRRLAERRIRELADSLNQAREAIFVVDVEGRITFWNKGAEQLTGWTSAEALDRTAADLWDPNAVQRMEAAWREADERGEWSGEFDVRHRTGEARHLEIKITSIRDDAGRPKSRLVFGADVTDRRAAERRIREQADMLNQASEAIFITDLDHRVIYWNAGAERLFGWTSVDAHGKCVEDLIDGEGAAAIQAARRSAVEQGHWRGELRVPNRQGEWIVVESRQTLIRDEAGRPKARLCINSDITERKRLEEQFLRAQRMENLGLLAAGIAHDLNNMLAPILLAAPMLRDQVVEPHGIKLLDTLEQSAERGSMLVRQILSFAHGVSGEQQLLQVKHLMRDIMSVVTGTFPKAIRLQDHVPSDLWPIKGNATQIHQVLLNLCVNARDAMPSGGTLRLVGENVELTAGTAALIEGARPGPFLLIRVEDTGMGIPPEILSEIWEPFFTTKEAEGGTGLGLSTVRGIVQAHQGFIDVKSTPGVGSEFRIYLPAAETGAPDGDAAEPRSLPRGQGELILVVDDEQQIRDMTSVILTRFGYRVVLACDGAEAAAIFAQRAAEIRLVISDLHMPNLDGAMLGQALRRINPAAKMIVMSGMTSALDSGLEFRAEEFCDAVLLKPFKPENLLEKVHEMLSGTPAAALS